MRERKNARQTFNFLMPACLIVCNCSYSFSLQLLFKQDIAWLHQRKLILTIAVFGCFTMKWVLWPNAPIIGGWAVLFTPRKYIFLSNTKIVTDTISDRFIVTTWYYARNGFLQVYNKYKVTGNGLAALFYVIGLSENNNWGLHKCILKCLSLQLWGNIWKNNNQTIQT